MIYGEASGWFKKKTMKIPYKRTNPVLIKNLK